MELKVIDVSGKDAGSVEVSDVVFDRPYNESLIHQIVVAYMSGERQGSKAQKTRSEVSGGGAKPFRQKGTGRARAGTTRGPIWVGGGRAFAARPDRNYKQKVNRKMYRGGMAAILAELNRQDRLVVMDVVTLSEPKTKAGKAFLKDHDMLTSKVLFVEAEADVNLARGLSGVSNVGFLGVGELNPYDLVAADKVVMSKAAVERIGAWLS
jgi:large subunit ribosomal protein L4